MRGWILATWAGKCGCYEHHDSMHDWEMMVTAGEEDVPLMRNMQPCTVYD